MRLSFDIPYVKLNFRTEILEDTGMPESKTAALRGGLGEMLLRQNCVCDRNCPACRFREACVVMHTFYSHMPSRPSYVTGKESVGYLLECTDRRTGFPRGSSFDFTLVLFGESIVFFNPYLQAFCQLGMSGLGRQKARFRIREVQNAQGEAIVRGNEVDMSRYRIEMLADYIAGRKRELRGKNRYEMQFLTPLCMKHQQKYMTEFNAEALVRGAARRVQMLDYYTGHETEFTEPEQYPVITRQRVRHASVKRYSSTQDTGMVLHGIIGALTLEEITEECLDCLLAGELIHMGKNISFGFGQYVLLCD